MSVTLLLCVFLHYCVAQEEILPQINEEHQHRQIQRRLESSVELSYFVIQCTTTLLSKPTLQDQVISKNEYSEFLLEYCFTDAATEALCQIALSSQASTPSENVIVFDNLTPNLRSVFIRSACPVGMPTTGDCLAELKELGDDEFGIPATADKLLELDEVIEDLCTVVWDIINTDGLGTIIEVTDGPTIAPAEVETTSMPTIVPTLIPTTPRPSTSPTIQPILLETQEPTQTQIEPSLQPTFFPSAANPVSSMPSAFPSFTTSDQPTGQPIMQPTNTSAPTVISATGIPSIITPTQQPSELIQQTSAPTMAPIIVPTNTDSPTVLSTVAPVILPTTAPIVAPTTNTESPTVLPTIAPAITSTVVPTIASSNSPTASLTASFPSTAPTTTNVTDEKAPLEDTSDDDDTEILSQGAILGIVSACAVVTFCVTVIWSSRENEPVVVNNNSAINSNTPKIKSKPRTNNTPPTSTRTHRRETSDRTASTPSTINVPSIESFPDEENGRLRTSTSTSQSISSMHRRSQIPSILPLITDFEPSIPGKKTEIANPMNLLSPRDSSWQPESTRSQAWG